MTSDDFVAHVAAHAGLPFARAEIATRAVLTMIGGYLSEARRASIAEELPVALRETLFVPRNAAVPLEEKLLAPGENVGHAREVIASVCRVLVEELSAESAAALRSALPAELARFLAEPASEATHEELVAGLRDTLSSGKPGSHHPISETPLDRRQSESVASSNPHGATKLSSSPGTTQARRHETLAEGQVDPHRQLATAK